MKSLMRSVPNEKNETVPNMNIGFHKKESKNLINTLYLTETAYIPRARLPSRSSRISRTSCLAVDSTRGLLMHSNSLQSSPNSIPSTILSASDILMVGSGDNSVLLESFVTARSIVQFISQRDRLNCYVTTIMVQLLAKLVDKNEKDKEQMLGKLIFAFIFDKFLHLYSHENCISWSLLKNISLTSSYKTKYQYSKRLQITASFLDKQI